MPIHILLILALIQGATEFLPVSSSAHLALFPSVFGVAPQPLLIDVAVHLGTLFAVLIYYRTDTVLMCRGVVDIFRGKVATQGARLVCLLSLATVPVVVAGLVLHMTETSGLLRSPGVIGAAMIIFAIPLYLADRTEQGLVHASGWTLRHAIWMGAAQALALIPGASRSGVTMTAARWFGYSREGAARLSMLMSIPTILASATLLGLDAAEAQSEMLLPAAFAALLSFSIAYVSIGVMLSVFKRFSMTPFVIYRVILGTALIALL
jgi:undecaprenyl-diphosphatase